MATTFLQAVGIQIAAYLAVMLFVVLVLNFLSQGFLTTWFRVKSSRGKLMLLKIRTIKQDYFASGKLDGGFLKWKRNGEEKRIALKDNGNFTIYRSMGVDVIDIDDEKNAIMLHDWSKVEGFDAEAFESLYKRALYKPQILDKNTQMILIGVVIVGLLVAGGFYLSYHWHQETMLAIQNIANIGQPVTQAVVQGGGA